MRREEMKEMKNVVAIPEGRFCGHNCADGCIYWNPYDRDGNGRQTCALPICADGCIYWNPYDRDGNGRQYCSHYDSYYYPRERQGCLSYK